MWDNSAYYYRKQITIDHTKVEDDLDNFPLLVSVTDNDLRTYANGGKMRHSSGYDVKFYLEDGTALDHEIDTYDASTGQFVAWVRIPELSDSEDTIIYMYYGNADVTSDPSTTAVWDENYVAVYHMNDVTTSTIKDSTSNANNGTKIGTNEPIQDTGKIGKGQNFDYVNDKIDVADSASLDTCTKITVSSWIKLDSVSGAYRTILGKNYEFGWEVETYGTTVKVDGRVGGVYYSGLIPITNCGLQAGVYAYITFTWDGSAGKLYKDNLLKYTQTLYSGDLGTNNSVMRFGVRAGYMDGIIDETRVSNIARSADWIKTEYANQNDPSSFVTFGSAETLGDGAFVKGRRATGTFILSTTTKCIDDMALRTSDGAVAGFVLVNTSDPKASPIRIKTGTGIRALRSVD